ncbi:component of the COPII coat of ER-golgi vesicles [Scheffersomyces coipomensis]|uniref:component of the COPII coat of ER-golgi vesicles n=1 Tax=Scheffersomyces coipomensis TaxID=1788519 RepID=UPI00315D845E
MVKLSEISRTSTFAWSSDTLPLLATGTVAGAVDANFNSSSSLEIWNIFSATNKDEPIFSASVDNRFYALAWSKPFEGRSQGLLAAAFENGTIEFWDVETLIKSKDLEKSSVHKSNKHTGPVKALQFNPIQNHVLVSGGSHGQIFIWDTKTFGEPFAPGQAMTPMDEITSVAWNNSVSHILASTGNSGYTSIWDLKSKKEVLHLAYTGASGRANFSHVAWHPNQSTKLITASDNDAVPLILTWDLRNSNAPEQILEGHKKGVLSLDWCKQDPSLLISSGKDNTTLLWNPITGQKLGEYPTTANWAFQTRFAPSAPDIFATASFDGKIIVQSLQDTSPPVSTKVSSNDDNVFWNQLSTTETQQPVFAIQQAPIWLKRPSSVSFGFGSKLVIVNKDENNKSIIKIQKFVTKGQENSTEFEEALKTDNFKNIIDTKSSADSITEVDKSDWELLKKLLETGKENLFKAQVNEKEEEKPVEVDKAEEAAEDDGAADDSFFDKLGNGSIVQSEENFIPTGSFKIFNDDESEDNKKLLKLALGNKIEDAVDECLKGDKLLEALLLALEGSDSVKQKVKNAYFKANSSNQVSRVLYSVTSNNVTDIVSNADVSNWREIASSIASFTSDSYEYESKIAELGDRILEQNTSKEQRDNAILCYLAGNAVDKIASIWLKELPEYETKILSADNKNISSPSEARFASLTNYAQKIAAYRSISKISGEISGPSAELIAKAILEFSNLASGYGQFDLAEKFLEILPTEFSGTEKERISKATGTAAAAASITSNLKKVRSPGPKPYSRLNSAANVNGHDSAVPKPYLGASSIPPIPAPSVNNAIPSNPYARGMKSSNPYAPQNTAAPANIYSPPAPPAPPLASSATIVPTIQPPPPPKTLYKNDTEGWNDLPETFKAKTGRRAAPVATATPSPTGFSPVEAPAAKRAVSGASAIAPPPPKGGLTRNSSKSSNAANSSPRPAPVHVNNRYAPPPSESAPPTVAVGGVPPPLASASNKRNPYAPAPVASPNRIAFAQPPAGNAGTFAPAVIPPPAPPKNPYAPNIKAKSPRISSGGIVPPPPPPAKVGSLAPPQPFGSHAPPIQPPFNSVPPPPGIAIQPPAIVPEPVEHVEPAKPEFPPGDRSHIPEKSLAIYTSLTNVLTAIKPIIPEKYAGHGQDMEKRLNILFDHLNNDDLLSDDAIEQLKKISSSLESRDFETATTLNIHLATNHSDEIGNWHRGVTRLITMSEAMY